MEAKKMWFCFDLLNLFKEKNNHLAHSLPAPPPASWNDKKKKKKSKSKKERIKNDYKEKKKIKGPSEDDDPSLSFLSFLPFLLLSSSLRFSPPNFFVFLRCFLSPTLSLSSFREEKEERRARRRERKRVRKLKSSSHPSSPRPHPPELSLSKKKTHFLYLFLFDQTLSLAFVSFPPQNHKVKRSVPSTDT